MTAHIEQIKDHYDIIDAIVYPYGSRVYGTHRYDSDYDYIVVAKNARDGDEDTIYISHDEINLHFHSPYHWIEMIEQHKIFALESIFQMPENDHYRKKFILDRKKLREEISTKASNSWVKCKKKLLVENDFHIGLKSLFHSFRIIKFGIQIAKYGKIVDYAQANPLYAPIMETLNRIDKDNAEEHWDLLSVLYKEEHNRLMTEFRILCPK